MVENLTFSEDITYNYLYNDVLGYMDPSFKINYVNNLYYQCPGRTIIPNIDTSGVAAFRSMCTYSKAYYIDLSKIDTSKATDMSNMFDGCSDVIYIDVSGFDTSNVTNMKSMFSSCSKLVSLDISHFDFSKVTDMLHLPGGYSDNTVFKHLKFGKNLKCKWMNYGCPSRQKALTLESLLSIIDGLYDFTGNGVKPTSSQAQIQFGADHLNTLQNEAPEALQIAIDKGWTLT